MPTNLLSMSRFARIAGVTPQAIQKLQTRGLAEAMVGRKVDANHPAAVSYLAEKGVRIGTPAPQPPKGRRRAQGPATPAPQAGPDLGAPQGLRDPTGADMIREGGVDNYIKVLQANKTAEDIKGKRILNEERQGKLVSRAFMDQYIFAALNTFDARLLTDVPRTLVRRVYSMAAAGAPHEEAEAVVVDLISAQIKAVKGAIDTAVQRFVKV